jgi:hypothetical protein
LAINIRHNLSKLGSPSPSERRDSKAAIPKPVVNHRRGIQYRHTRAAALLVSASRPFFTFFLGYQSSDPLQRSVTLISVKAKADVPYSAADSG